jgi:hypothetical protein
VVTVESAGLTAWYRSRPVSRRFAVRDTEGVRVLLHVERAFANKEIHPAWIANLDVWIEGHPSFSQS